MSKIKKSKYFSKKGPKVPLPYHDGHNYQKNDEKFVTIKFHFFGKGFKRFFLISNYGNIWKSKKRKKKTGI
jgi:hypothetical protein